MNVYDVLNQRKLPELTRLNLGKQVRTETDWEVRREEIKLMLQEYEYGFLPSEPDHVTVGFVKEDAGFCAGKAIRRDLIITAEFGSKSFTFPFISVIPVSEEKVPAFVNISFYPELPCKTVPIEEIVDSGFAVFSFWYKDITSDDGDFEDGLADLLGGFKRKKSAPGKIAMWAWAAMRIMDYVESLDSIDTDNVAVIGHSRLGKTALLAGGFDTRFRYVISNDSGCSGAALTRGKIGESLNDIVTRFPFWFCPGYSERQAHFHGDGYDQHFLLALTAPRVLMVGSAEEDIWADPESEFLGVVAANDAFKLLGCRGLVHGDEIPKAKCVLDEGDVFYHVRKGTHYLSREDWGEYMKYIKKMMKEEG